MQNWLKTRFNYLRKQFASKPFVFEELKGVLDEKFHDKEEKLLVMLSELNKEGLLKIELDETDNRKKIYHLIDPKLELLKKEVLDRSDLEGILKEAADLIRTKVDYSFILLLLFYKKVSDKWESDYEKALHESLDVYKLSEEEAKQNAENPTYHDFIIPKEYLWNSLRKESNKLAENFSMAMKVLAEKNPGYKDVFENFDFAQFVSNRENQDILSQLVEIFSINSLDKASSNVLGDAYEWLIRLFAPQKAKEGEVYTPREIIDLLVHLLTPQPNESIYDPSLGSAGMLIGGFNFVKEKFGEEAAKTLFLYGQEANYRTRSIAKMNLYLHGIKNGTPEYGDTLLYPKFRINGALQKFDVVMANPPWNQDGYGEDSIKKGDFWKERFNEYGFAPDQSADWMWIAHMFASSTEDKGRLGIVMDNGALFRGGKERVIREKFVKQSAIECVIVLPEKLFYNTGAPGAILVLNKNKRPETKDKIIFINASNEFIKHPEVRRLNSLSVENIENIVNAYKTFGEKEGFSRAVELKEIVENDFNLNVSLYVYPQDEKEHIDVRKEWNELEKIERELKDVDARLEKYLSELNY
ncbi:MAG: SAM-dependent methyltransferase [Ignavibacteriaceae bacterium]|nr:SAM-dependent methyltransferase [Ignavibacteriaceae bacterium]